jgi:ABC-2 type transport system ATP-binding protein
VHGRSDSNDTNNVAFKVIDTLYRNNQLNIKRVEELKSIQEVVNKYADVVGNFNQPLRHDLFAIFRANGSQGLSTITFHGFNRMDHKKHKLLTLQFDMAVSTLSAFSLIQESPLSKTNSTIPYSVTFRPSRTRKAQAEKNTEISDFSMQLFGLFFFSIVAIRIIQERKRGIAQIYSHWNVLTSAQLWSHSLSVLLIALMSALLSTCVLYNLDDRSIIASQFSFMDLYSVWILQGMAFISYGLFIGTIFDSQFAVVIQAFLLVLQDELFKKLMQFEMWSKVTHLIAFWRTILPVLNFRQFQNNLEMSKVGLQANFTQFVFAASLACALYWVAAWYFSQSLPRKQKAKQAPWFFLLPSYWVTRKTFNEHEDSLSRKTITLHNVSKSFDTKKVLENICLEVKKGHLYSVLGRNGAGKSTLMKILSGQLSLTTGSACLFGYNMNEHDEMSQMQPFIAYCAQENHFWKELTVFEHIRLFSLLSNQNNLSGRDGVSLFLDELGLCEVMDKKVCELSGGMQRRFNLALASIRKCWLVLLDEPTSGVDRITMKKIWRFVNKLKEDRVVLLATHCMEEAETLSDEIIFLHNGVVQVQGTPRDIRQNYTDKCELLLSLSEDLKERVKVSLDNVLGETTEPNQYFEGNLHISFKKEKMCELIKALDSYSTHKQVQWQIRSSSLEDVFCNLCPQEQGIPTAFGDQDLPNDVSTAHTPQTFVPVKPTITPLEFILNQIHAIFIKNFLLLLHKPFLLSMVLLALGTLVLTSRYAEDPFRRSLYNLEREENHLNYCLRDRERHYHPNFTFAVCHLPNKTTTTNDSKISKYFEKCVGSSLDTFNVLNDRNSEQTFVFELKSFDSRSLDIALYFDPEKSYWKLFEMYKYMMNTYIHQTLDPSLNTMHLNGYHDYTPTALSGIWKLYLSRDIWFALGLGMIPLSCHFIMYEKRKGLFRMLKFQGLNSLAYFIGMYLFHLLLAVGMAIVIVILNTWIYSIFTKQGESLLFIFLGLVSTASWNITFAYVLTLFLRNDIGVFIAVLVQNYVHYELETLVESPWIYMNPAGMFHALISSAIANDMSQASLMIGLLLLQSLGLLMFAILGSNVCFDTFEAKRYLLPSRNIAEKSQPYKIDCTQRVGEQCPDAVREKDGIIRKEKTSQNRALLVQGLSHWYAETRVLNNVNLAVNRGECFGLLGPNGAGN